MPVELGPWTRLLSRIVDEAKKYPLDRHEFGMHRCVFMFKDDPSTPLAYRCYDRPERPALCLGMIRREAQKEIQRANARTS